MIDVLNNALKSLAENMKDIVANPTTIITIIVLVVLAVVMFSVRTKGGYTTKTLTYGAISIAIAFVLSMIKFSLWPEGGSITLASMLPIFIFGYIAGWRAGLLAGICYGILQFIQVPYFFHPAQFLLDYPLAFGLLGFAGIFRKNIFLVVIAGGMLRFICHFLSGVIFFASYAPKGQSVYYYSLWYNGSYMLPEIIICIVILLIPSLRSAINRLKLT